MQCEHNNYNIVEIITLWLCSYVSVNAFQLCVNKVYNFS